MPRPPQTSPALREVGGSVFSGLSGRLASYSGETFALQVGDTWMAPAVTLGDLAEDAVQHRYAPPRGTPALVAALAARVTARHGVRTATSQVLVTAGATGGLAVACAAMLAPGEEVLVLAPHWPLISGIVRAHGGVPVPVDVLGVDVGAELVQRLDRACGDRAVALYLGTPNNPTGAVLGRAALGAIADWARDKDLWLLADEVYEAHQFVGEHVPMRSVAPERTVSVHSFSKAFGQAGHRCGYLAGPVGFLAAAHKASVHTTYSISRVSQALALGALGEAGDAWVAKSRVAYRAAGTAAARRLGVPLPDGGTFLFVDVSEALGPRGLLGFLESAADRGLFLAPGTSFGPYPHHVRVCFTATAPEETVRGVAVLAELLGR